MTVVVVHRDGAVAGAIGGRDELRPEVPQVIATLAGQGIGVTMLTGDNERTARALAAQAGISDVRAELRPEGKSAAVGELGATLMEFRQAKVILVSNEVGLGIVPDNALARRFRDAAGRLNQMVAARADRVLFMVAGLPMTVK